MFTSSFAWTFRLSSQFQATIDLMYAFHPWVASEIRFASRPLAEAWVKPEKRNCGYCTSPFKLRPVVGHSRPEPGQAQQVIVTSRALRQAGNEDAPSVKGMSTVPAVHASPCGAGPKRVDSMQSIIGDRNVGVETHVIQVLI